MTSRRSQLQEDTYFRVLSMLQDNPDMTQREIAERLGVSTSGMNYCLNALIDKGTQLQSIQKQVWLHLRADAAGHYGKSHPDKSIPQAQTSRIRSAQGRD